MLTLQQGTNLIRKTKINLRVLKTENGKRIYDFMP